MRNIVFIIVLLFTSFMYAQLNPAEAMLKTGEKLIVMGKISGESFLYKIHKNGSPKRLHFSKLNYVKIMHSKKKISTYKLFKIKGTDEGVVLEEIIVGEKASLYFKIIHGNTTVAGGGIFPVTSTSYYAVKKSDEKATYLGVHNLLSDKLKEKVLSFFKDCEILVEKIKNKEFRVKNDMGKITEFYNTECK
jgi:hypothetical protein